MSGGQGNGQSSDQWLMRAGGGLSAHFKQPEGPSRPGTDWTVGLTRGAEVHTVTVRTYYADDLAKQYRDDSQYQVQTAMQYLDALLQKGWDPANPGELAITLTNPPGTPADAPPKKPSWKFW
jgi:hypothetical protein